MIYLNAKRIFSTERSADIEKSVEIINALLPDLSNVKIIYIIGDNAYSCGSYVSSVLERSGFKVGVCHANSVLEARDKISVGASSFPTQEICERLERLVSSALTMGRINNAKSGRSFDTLPLSPESVLCLFAFDCFAQKDCELAIFECSEYFFENILSKLSITPLCSIFTSFDEIKISELIDTMPCGTKEIVRFSQKEDFDFISNKFSSKGARINTVSENKINIGKTNIYGTDLYYNSVYYHIQAVERKNVTYAALAIECIKALSRTIVPIAQSSIYKGLASVRLLYELELFSVSPLIFLKANNSDEDPDVSFLNCKKISVIKEDEMPQDIKNMIKARDFDALILTGSLEFIKKIKNIIK